MASVVISIGAGLAEETNKLPVKHLYSILLVDEKVFLISNVYGSNTDFKSANLT